MGQSALNGKKFTQFTYLYARSLNLNQLNKLRNIINSKKKL